MSAEPEPTVVIGMGNPFRGDDGAGRMAAELLKVSAPAGVEIIQRLGDCAGLIDAWRGRRRVIVVDAMQAGAEPGTIVRFQIPPDSPDMVRDTWSSHSLGLADAIGISEKLGWLPGELVIYGIEGRAVRQGLGVSIEATLAAAQVSLTIAEELAAETG